MQSAEDRSTRTCLLLALRRYSTAVNEMEHTILLPSLLRDVPSDDVQDWEEVEGSCQDLYEHYHMLKAIRNIAESGLVPQDHDLKAQANATLHETMEPLMKADPEALFHFHLQGLFSVMGSLTQKSLSLTNKYMDIIGVSN